MDKDLKDLVEIYCEAWEESYTRSNPFETITYNEKDLIHIAAGIESIIQSIRIKMEMENESWHTKYITARDQHISQVNELEQEIIDLEKLLKEKVCKTH